MYSMVDALAHQTFKLFNKNFDFLSNGLKKPQYITQLSKKIPPFALKQKSGI